MKPKPKAKAILLMSVFIAAVLLFSFVNNKKEMGNLPSVTISPNIPSDVDPATNTFPGNPIAFFDDYSWRVFLAMVWPAKNGQRGVADPSLSLDEPNVPRVFETFKSDWEIFKPDGAAPSDWEKFDGAVPCATQPIGFNDMVLASFSKFGNLGEAGFGNLVGPLVSQNNKYVRYLTGFNQVEFTQVMNGKFYLRSNLTNVSFPSGSIDVKSAWIDMRGIGHPERYYTRKAWVLDPASGVCNLDTVGLVGLHIVQKTPSRPQWIWSTFEQIDNIPQPGAQAPFAFNDGSVTPMPNSNPIGFPPPGLPPAPFNVTRVKPIHPSTVTTNQAYQQALQAMGSKWQFYQLVATQWPVPGNSPTNPGDPTHTFPGTTSATTAFANTTLETFDQNVIRTSCMACHNFTGTGTDFLWSLQVNAFPSAAPLAAEQIAARRPLTLMALTMKPKKAIKNKPLQQLKELLQQKSKP